MLVIKHLKDTTFLAGTPSKYYWSSALKNALTFEEKGLPLVIWGMYYDGDATYSTNKPMAKVITKAYAERLLAENGTLQHPMLGRHWINSENKTISNLIQSQEIKIYRTKGEAKKDALAVWPSYCGSLCYILGKVWFDNPNKASVLVADTYQTFTFTGIE